MTQTYYKVPFSRKWHFGIVGGCTLLFLILFFTLGASHPAPWVFIGLAFAISILGGLLDPGTARQFWGQLEDGTAVVVRRPLIGFKSHETKVVDEVAEDWRRYEEAIFRI